MKRVLIAVAVLAMLSMVAGATVFRDDIAQAAQTVSAQIIGPLDQQGNVKVHESGTPTVKVDGSVETRSADQTALLFTNHLCGRDAQTTWPNTTMVAAPFGIGTDFRAIRVTFTGTPDLEVFVHDNSDDGQVFDTFTIPASGFVSRVYEAPPPTISINCDSPHAQFSEPGLLTVYGRN
jgi:hypothetical protein